jgi:putative FmdB family regulatory protein
MPLFDLRCSGCAHQYEALTSPARISETICPKCGADQPERLISRFAVAQNFTPCGTRAADIGPTCGFGSGGCGRCAD